jgi:cyclic-di-AMP phosphodiesterase PgpH
MRLFAPRRSRSTKAANLTASASLSGRLSGQLRNIDLLLRLAIGSAFLLLLMVVLGSWQAPLPYHVGQRVKDGIVASVDFSRTNFRKTELARLESERRVPLVFRNQLDPLRDQEYLLRSDLFDVASVHDFTELSNEVRTAFGFPSAEGLSELQGVSLETAQKSWTALRGLLGQPGMSAERQIDEIIGEFLQFTQPLRDSGVLDPDEIDRLDLTADRSIRVMSELGSTAGDGASTTLTVADVLLNETLKAGGRLARQWNQFPTLNTIQPVIERWLLHRTPATLSFDQDATNRDLQEIRRQTPLETDRYKRGQLLAAPGTWIDEEVLEILRAQHQTIESSLSWRDRLVRLSIVAVLLIVLAVVNGYYLIRNEPRLLAHVGRLTVYLAVITLTIGISKLMSSTGSHAEIVPILTCVMILAVAYNQVLAALTGFSLSLLVTLAIGGPLADFIVMMSATAAAVVPLHQVASRSKMVVVGFWTALTYLFVSFGVASVETQQLSDLWTQWPMYADAFSGAGWCFAAGFLVAGSLPFIEQLFGVVTDISLLELSDISHPLLQELVRRAPGTYNHSIAVATIAETAADRIGANGLLCRVGAYYHDIGKMLKPQYFVENMTSGQASRHQSLNPAMSTLIIIGHVKDGVDLAEQQNLPRALIDFIEQHHGTTLVEYFFHAASRQAEQQPEEFRNVVEESSFRYPGPRPQSREAAVLMIADAVESASRALNEPTPKRIEELVHNLAMKRLLDGQFDECSLTISELAQIEDSLTKSLIGIHHGRIKYPEQRTA